MKEVLTLPVDEAVARICRGYLKDAQRALPGVHDPDNSEALHDFRVALRRLRSYLRSYRGSLRGAIPEKSYRRIKKLASRTNQTRDVEVMLVWLETEITELTPRQRVGAEWWRERLGSQYEELYNRLGESLDEEFNVLAEQLEKKLRRMIKRPHAKRSFGRSTASQLSRLINELDMELNQIHSMDDTVPIHQARITGKRLRYLLEPPGKTVLVCKHAAKSMQLFQDMFGNLNDCFVRQDVIRKTIALAATEWAEQQLEKTLSRGQVTVAASEVMPGLLALARRNQAASKQYYREIEIAYLQGGRERLFNHLNGVVELLKS